MVILITTYENIRGRIRFETADYVHIGENGDGTGSWACLEDYAGILIWGYTFAEEVA